jgi:hypothetical protein
LIDTRNAGGFRPPFLGILVPELGKEASASFAAPAMGLPPKVMSPTLSASDKSFHSDAIHRAFPQFAAIPFERKDAPRRDARRHDARFAADVARFMLTHRRAPKRVLNGRYVFPRLLFGLAHVWYRQSHRWLAGIALYLFQLELAAGGRLTLEDRRPARSGRAA